MGRLLGLFAASALLSCSSKQADRPPAPTAQVSTESPGGPSQKNAADPDDIWANDRELMLGILESRGIDPQVRAAMAKVPREKFVPRNVRHQAYGDHPLPIGHDVTISQPYIVALMTQLAEVEAGDRILEIGTGSGYQAAVLATLGAEVFSIEIIEPLAQSASALLKELGYTVQVRQGDGYQGWPEQAPFDAILVTAAPPSVPEPLKKQLAVGGRLVIPVGRVIQELVVIERRGQGYVTRTEIPVRFVPMTGRAQEREPR